MSKPDDITKPQPCPGCGNENPAIAEPRWGTAVGEGVWQVFCECGMSAPTALSPERATAQWNVIRYGLRELLAAMQAAWRQSDDAK